MSLSGSTEWSENKKGQRQDYDKKQYEAEKLFLSANLMPAFYETRFLGKVHAVWVFFMFNLLCLLHRYYCNR